MDRIIILVHGIRTFGAWQNRLASILEREIPGVQVHIYKYGYLSTLVFCIPVLRNLVIRRFQSYLENRIPRSKQVRVDIVAHSFGTYVVARALRDLPAHDRPAIHTLVLSGSVLKQLFPWEGIVGPDLSVKRIINDCGIRDRWPIVAQLLVFGMGIAGRRGFAGVTGKAVGIVNRFFSVAHSGFFTDEFMKKNWLPLFVSAEVPPGPELIPPKPGLGAALEYYADPLKLFILLAPVIGVGYYVQEQNIARANAEIAQFEEQRLKEEAEERARGEEAQKLLAQAEFRLRSNPVEALFLAIRAGETHASAEAGRLQELAATTLVRQISRQEEFGLAWNEFGGWLGGSFGMFQGKRIGRTSADGRFTLLSEKSEILLVNNESATFNRPEAGCRDGEVSALGFSRSQSYIVGATYFGASRPSLFVYDTEGKLVAERCKWDTKDQWNYVDLLGGDSILVASANAGQIMLFEIDTSTTPAELKPISYEFEYRRSSGPVKHLQVGPKEEYLLTVHRNGDAILWSFKQDVEQGQPLLVDLHTFEIPIESTSGDWFKLSKEDAEKVSYAWMHRDQEGLSFVTTAKEGPARLWRWQDKTMAKGALLEHGPSSVRYAAFNVTGDKVLTLGSDGSIRIWRARTGELLTSGGS